MMNQNDRTKIIMNYYKATNALSEIGTMENLPDDLLDICAAASNATTKIIHYINDLRECPDEKEEPNVGDCIETTRYGICTIIGKLLDGGYAVRCHMSNNENNSKVSISSDDIIRVFS